MGPKKSRSILVVTSPTLGTFLALTLKLGKNLDLNFRKAAADAPDLCRLHKKKKTFCELNPNQPRSINSMGTAGKQ